MRARAPPKPKPRALSGRVRGALSGADPIKVGVQMVSGHGLWEFVGIAIVGACRHPDVLCRLEVF